MAGDLKKCPFCGSDEIEMNHITPSWTDDYWRVGCPWCGAWIEDSSEENARVAWNRRVQDGDHHSD